MEQNTGVPAFGAPDVPDVSATAIDPPIADIRAAIGALDVRAFSSSESIFWKGLYYAMGRRIQF